MDERHPKIIVPRGTHGDAEATRDFQRMVAASMEAGENELIADLTNIRVMESIFLGALVATAHTLRASGGNLRLSSVSPELRAVLQLSGVDKLIEVTRSVDEALRRFEADRMTTPNRI